jgi:hypothetical protein
MNDFQFTGIESFNQEPWNFDEFKVFYNKEVGRRNQQGSSHQYHEYQGTDLRTFYELDTNIFSVQDFAKRQFEIDQLS